MTVHYDNKHTHHPRIDCPAPVSKADQGEGDIQVKKSICKNQKRIKNT